MDEMQNTTQEQVAQVDFVKELESGNLKPDKLSDEQLVQFLESGYEDPSTMDTADADPEPVVETEPPKAEEKHAKKDLKEEREALWKIQVEENRQKQKFEAARKKREELEERLRGTLNKGIQESSYKKPEGYDPYAEENLSELPVLKQKYSDLEKKMSELEEWRAQKEQERIQNELYDLEMDQIKTLQEEFPELKTSKSFKKVEEDYTAWYNALGPERANRYLSDPEFKARMDNQGFKIPEDFDNYAALYEVRKAYKEGQYRTLRDAFRSSNLFDQVIERRYSSKQQQTVSDAKEKVAEKLAQIKSQTPILNTTQSSTPIEKLTMNEKEMEKELIRLGSKKTLSTNDKAIYDAIMEQLGLK